MTATTITPITGTPIAGARHTSARTPRTRVTFPEVQEARRGRLLAASALLTGIGAVSVFAVAAITVGVAQ